MPGSLSKLSEDNSKDRFASESQVSTIEIEEVALAASQTSAEAVNNPSSTTQANVISLTCTKDKKEKKKKKKVVQTEGPSTLGVKKEKPDLTPEEKRAAALAAAERAFQKGEGDGVSQWSRERSIAWLWLLAFPLVYIIIGWMFCIVMNKTNPGAYPQRFLF